MISEKTIKFEEYNKEDFEFEADIDLKARYANFVIIKSIN